MVKQEDLIGAIKDFPIAIVELMIANQVAQGNPANIKVFQTKADAPATVGGFSWYRSKEGAMFWSRIINARKFDTPIPGAKIEVAKEVVKEEPKTQEETDIQEEIVVGSKVMVDFSDFGTSNIKKSKSVLSILEGDNSPLYVCVSESLLESFRKGISNIRGISIHSNVTLYKPEPEKVKLTLKDISEGKGVGVPPELIEIIQ